MSQFAKIEEAAREKVLCRLRSRPKLSVPEVIETCGLDHEQGRRAEMILESMESVLGIPTAGISPNDRLRDVFRVYKSEFDAIPAGWDRTQLGDYIEVFAYDLMNMLERLSTRSAWAEKRLKLPSPPSNEEEWIDLVLEMTLCDFLRFFSGTTEQ